MLTSTYFFGREGRCRRSHICCNEFLHSAWLLLVQVVEHCLRVISEQHKAPLSGSSAESAAPQSSAGLSGTAEEDVSTPGKLVGEVLARLCRRGHAQLVAGALWSTIANRVSPNPELMQNGHAHAPSSAEAQHDISDDSPADGADLSARRGSHAGASTSEAPAAPDLAPARIHSSSSSRKPPRSKFAFPTQAMAQPPKKNARQEVLLQSNTRQEQQGEDTQRRAFTRREMAEGCARVRAAMQSVEDAAALEKLLEALLREAARDLEAGEQVEAGMERAAGTLMAILDGPLLARPEVRWVTEPRQSFSHRRCRCDCTFVVFLDRALSCRMEHQSMDLDVPFESCVVLFRATVDAQAHTDGQRGL